ncbi:MAG TPA: rod shape-determining protein RodA [Ktedonobacteraceae bacterium]|jgi:rod shape determining protein RodA|nr:rod shape-determining protein RodA [Ktedonobacteraceae bacterium]
MFSNIDWVTVLVWLAMLALGWGNVYSAVYDEDHPAILDFSQKYGKQLLWICGALVIAFVLLIIDAEFHPTFAWIIYGVSMFTLVLVMFLGREVAGSKSWFRFGDFGIQPAEFAKFSTCLALAKYLSDINIKMADTRTRLIAFGIILLPTALIILEKETGCAIVLMVLILVLYREGLPGYLLVLCLALAFLFFSSLVYPQNILLYICAGLAVLTFIFIGKKLKNIIYIGVSFVICAGIILSAKSAFEHFPNHQKKRINVFLGIETDKKDKAWNENESIIAIGSGGFAGKGYLQGTQTKYDFVPAQETDFIFCTVGEEWGFLGSTFIVILFAFLIIRIIFLAERQRSSFSRIYGYGVASIFLFHVLVNIGMTIRLVPVIGIPLPFFSYGGSSLWAFTMLLFIFIKLDSQRLMILR